MKSRWWDPGIGRRDRIERGYYGESNQEGRKEGSISYQIGIAMGQGKEISSKIELVILAEDWYLGSTIITTQSTGYQGEYSQISLFTKMGKDLMRFGKLETWKINYINSGIDMDYLWSNGNKIRVHYKSSSEQRFLFISLKAFSFSKFICKQGFSGFQWHMVNWWDLWGIQGMERES